MKNRRPINAFAPQEVRKFVIPMGIGSALLWVSIAIGGLLATPAINIKMISFGVLGLGHLLLFSRSIVRSTIFRQRYSSYFSITTGVGLGLLVYVLPGNLEIFGMMAVISIVGMAAISGRIHGYVVGMLAFLISTPFTLSAVHTLPEFTAIFSPFLLSIIIVETYMRIKDSAQQHIQRLETINKASRRLMQSLDQDEVLALLNSTMLDTLEADSYFVGTLKDDQTIRLDLMYDEGEFYNGTEMPISGTLSGWIIKNQKELYLPDLREDVQLEGVEVRVIGKDKASLSWIGVPLKTANISGIMAMASYKPNAFDLADMELLLSLAQHVTLALDNTARHAQVEEQARLDSLTGVYNHGYFLKRLSEQADAALLNKTPLSLIMLDIDYFKQYNDTYGHLVGDRILTSLCTAIRHHIKQGDAVGRWGGEEFVISLPNATGDQAAQVAKRIGETMMMLRVEDRDQRTVPVPTVSQGIAVFPNEADEIYRLIDLADRRLYLAKERGRNQIEPGIIHWDTLEMEKN